MKNKTIYLVIGIIVIIAIIWISISMQGQGEIKIGVILPLTGDLAPYGEGAKNAITMALEDSGLKNKIELIIEDDLVCDSIEDVSAVNKLIEINKVDAILGPVCSSSVHAVLPITEEAKILVVSPAAESESLSGAGNYFFRTIASDASKSKLSAEFAYNKGYTRTAILFDSSNDAFVYETENFKKVFEELGGEIVKEESFSDSKDFRTQLTKIKNSNADVVFLSCFPEETSLAINQMTELGISLPIIGTEASESLLSLGKDVPEGFAFPTTIAPTNEKHLEFNEKYKTRFGKDAMLYTTESYDAAFLLIKAIEKSDKTTESIKENLYSLGQDYQGVSGVITFEENGNVIKPVIMKIFKDGQFVLYDF